MSVRRTFGILISARGLVGCAFRCYGWGPRPKSVWRAWRFPAAHKKRLEWPPNGLERGGPRGRTLFRSGGRYSAAILAIAQAQHAISRAVAQLATTGRLPAPAIASLRSMSLRLHLVACLLTAGATSWPGASGFGSREDIGTCQAASTRAERTWALPARVIPPFDDVSPLECSEGVRPHHDAKDGAVGKREKSPASQASRNAVATSKPFTHLRASTTGLHSGLPADSATFPASSSRAS